MVGRGGDTVTVGPCLGSYLLVVLVGITPH